MEWILELANSVKIIFTLFLGGMLIFSIGIIMAKISESNKRTVLKIARFLAIFGLLIALSSVGYCIYEMWN